MAKKPPSDDEGSIVILDSDSEEEKIEQGKQSAAEGKHITEDLSSKDESEGDEEECDEYEEEEDNEETSSGSDTEHVLDEYDIVTDEPKLSVEVHTSDDDMIEEEGSHKKPTQVQTVSVAGMFKNNEPCVKGLIEKEPMDFETCISVNEISKYEQSQGKVSEVMELSCEEENAGDRALIMDQHMMDFEVEISASHISKPKQTDDRNEPNTQISVENKVVLSEMKEESVTVPETAEVFTEDGKFVEEEHDLIVRQKKEQIVMEKLAQKDENIAVQLTSTENIPKPLQQDGTDVMEITVLEEEVLHGRTVGSGVSNVCSQQAVQELDITRCGIKARKTSESSSPPVDKLQLSSDFEGRSQDVKPRKTSRRASSFPRDIIHVDENTESRDIKVYRNNKVTTEEKNVHSECEEGRIHRAVVEECSVPREKSQKTESSEVEVDRLTSTAVSVGVVDSNKTTGSKLNSKEGSFQHDIPAVDVDSHETGISKQSDREGAVQRDVEVIDEEVYGSKADESSSTAVSSEHHIMSGNVICKPRSRACSVQREDVDSVTCEIELDKPSSRASPVQHEDVPLDEVETCERRVCKSGKRARSVQHDDVPSHEIGTYERKACEPSSKGRSVERDSILSDETEECETEVCKPRASSSQYQDVRFVEGMIDEGKVCKPASRASSVVCEDIPSAINSHDKKVHRPSSKANSVQLEDVHSDEIETCERKVLRPSSRAGSVQREDIHSDEIETCERRVRKPSSRAGSVQREDIHSDETETYERKVLRPSSRAGSVQHEDIHSDQMETCERKVRKPSSRAGSVQREDIHSDDIVTCERKVRKPSGRAGSIQREDIHSDETETYERKVLRPSSRAGSVQHEDIHSDQMETCERKVRKPSSRAGSVQREDIHSDEIETCERKVRKPSGRAGSIQREDIHSDETETYERKVLRPSSRAGSVQHEDIHSDQMETCERKVRKPSSRAGSVQREDIHSDEIETCERKVRKPSGRAGSIQREDIHSDETETYERKVLRPSSRAGSVQREDIHSDETETCEREVRKPSSRAGSVQREDIHSDEIETCERKVRKPSSRAGSVQREDIHSDETETYERKVLRPSSRAGSVQREDVHSDEIEARGKKVRRPSSRASSVQREVSAGETECEEGAVRKHKSRSSSIQCEDVSSDEVGLSDRKVQKLVSRVSSIQHEDVPIDEADDNKKEAHKFSNRGGSAQQQVVPTSEAESVKKRVRKPNRRAGSVHRNLEVIEEESQNTGAGKPDSGVNSAHYVDIPSEKADSDKCKVDEPEAADSVKCIDITEEDSHYRPISRASSVDSRDVTLAADFVCNENRSPTSSSVNSDASTVVREESAHWARRTRKSSARSRHSSASSRCSSAQGDEGTDVKDNKMHANRPSRAGLIQQNVILGAVHEASEEMIENTKETESSSRGVPVDGNIVGVSTEGPRTNNSSEKVDNFGRKAKKKYSEAGPSHSNFDTNTGSTMEVKYSDLEDSNAKIEGSSINKILRESKDVRGKIKKSHSSGNVHDAGSVKLDLTPPSGMHHDDLAAETDCKKEKTSKAICGAISVSALDDQGISGPSVPPNELFRFKSNIPSQPYRKAQSECEYPVVPNIESRRFTRSTLGISARTTTADTGSITDNSTSTKKSRRSDIGSQRMGDSSCSERSSGSSVQWKRKACSPTRGDSLRTRQVIEEYTTNRRLTRHQRLVLERSLELTKLPLAQLRHRKLPSLPENSDDVDSGEEDKSSSQISSAGTRSSSRLRSRALCESPSSISQASTVHLPPTESPLRRAGMETRSSRKTLLKLQEETRSDSPSPTKSEASSYAYSAASLPIHLGASPSSTHSEDVTLGRVRRRSFRQAQLALRSMSDQGSVSGLPSGTKPRATSPGDSDSNVSSDAGSSHTSLTSAGSHITRSVALRMGRSRSEGEIRCSPRLARLQEEEHCSASSSTSFRFSPPTLVGGTIKKEESLAAASPSPVPAFVFSPPQKQQPVPKLHRQNAPSQQSRAHTMALRGLHTITEESIPPSTPTNTSPLQASERETTPIAVKKSKKFKPTPSSKTPHTSSRHNAMTPMTNQEQRELVKCERLRQSISMEPHRRYTAFRHRKLFKIRRNSKSD
ncbi:uncharacterized protein LOC111866916 [Cryptotermes secundus]|nr:uncharacterized protein LOC111866916 [Cryptotermes secundus]